MSLPLILLGVALLVVIANILTKKRGYYFLASDIAEELARAAALAHPY